MDGMLFLACFDDMTFKTNAFYSALSAGCTTIAVQLTRGNSINHSNVKIEMIYLHSTLFIVSVTRNFARLPSWDDKIHLRCTVVNMVSFCSSPQHSNSWWPTCERNEMVYALYSKVIQHCNVKSPFQCSNMAINWGINSLSKLKQLPYQTQK